MTTYLTRSEQLASVEILTIILSYLTNRKQCVEIEGSNSTLRIVTSGVPQDSIMGPSLFLLFLNVLAKTPGNKNRFVYADEIEAILLNQQSLDNTIVKIQK